MRYYPEAYRLQDEHQLDLAFFDFQAFRRASQLFRVQQIMKNTLSTEDALTLTPSSSWRILLQDQKLRGLTYDRYVEVLNTMVPT